MIISSKIYININSIKIKKLNKKTAKKEKNKKKSFKKNKLKIMTEKITILTMNLKNLKKD